MVLETVLLVIAAAGMYEGLRLSKSSLLFVDPVGPGWYLFFMACLLFLCALALLARQFAARRAGRSEAAFSLHRGPAGRALILLTLYAAAVPYLGYLLASGLFFIVIQRVFGERSWPRCAAVGISITACFYLVFAYLAGMPLP